MIRFLVVLLPGFWVDVASVVVDGVGWVSSSSDEMFTTPLLARACLDRCIASLSRCAAVVLLVEPWVAGCTFWGALAGPLFLAVVAAVDLGGCFDAVV